MENIINDIIESVKGFISSNWDFCIGIIVALFAGKFLKASLEIISSIIIIIVALYVLRTVGVLPPLDQLWDSALQVIDKLTEGFLGTTPVQNTISIQ